MTQIRSSSSGWPSTFEQRVLLYEEYAAAVEARLTQLIRESDRGIAPLLAELPELEHEEQLSGGTVICVACRRDHHTEPGLELMTAEGEPVCWACGRAGEPTLAAQVLASAADHAERAALDICQATNGFLLDLIRSRGNAKRADALEATVLRIQALVRESRRRGHADPAMWLGFPPQLEQAG
jgi:hypothetical protein